MRDGKLAASLSLPVDARERPAFARNRLLSPSSPTTSSSSSSDSNDNSDSDSDDDDDDAPDAVSAILSSEEGSDSEEDEFPVNPSQAEARRSAQPASTLQGAELELTD